MARRSRSTRWRRIPGTFRFHERKPDDPGREELRLSLYLTAEQVDHAAELAAAAGKTTQAYCSELLASSIAAERARRRLEDEEARRGTLEGFRAIEDDPVYLSEWKAAGQPRPSDLSNEIPSPKSVATEALLERERPSPLASDGPTEMIPISAMDSQAVGVVLRHAGIGPEDDPSGLLPSLRRGDGVGPAAARELLAALEQLEAALAAAEGIDRTLAYALHRLAFEGQILITDAWSALPADPATVDILRLVQEGVDRVLSGQDIRYYPRDSPPELLP